ncbi:MAG: metallopeptidase [Actinomycetota bacterium]
MPPRRILLLPLALAAISALGQASAAPELRITNVASGATVRYPVVILRGTVGAPDGTEITISNETSRRPSRNFRTRVEEGRLVGLVELVPGDNRIYLSGGGAALPLSLTFQPQTNPHYVRMVYYTDNSGETAYQSERVDDSQDYAARLDASAKLLQAFTAESMNDQGLGRKTFNLELDEKGQVKVHTVKGAQPVEHYHARDGLQLYREIQEDLNRRMPDRYAKNVAVMAFTRFDPETRMPKAHTALGGGNLGLFGSAGMFTWPARVPEIQAAFQNTARVDPRRTHDDSNGRGNYWGLGATTLGAVIHEMGHTFGLPHSTDRYDIMTRGFDHLNRMFTVTEPPHARRAEPLKFAASEIAQFRPISAQRLAYSRWFQLDAQERRPDPQLVAEVNVAAGKVVMRAKYGLRLVGINGGGDARENEFFPKDAPTVLEYSLDELRQRAGGKELSLALMDSDGNEQTVGANRLRAAE